MCDYVNHKYVETLHFLGFLFLFHVQDSAGLMILLGQATKNTSSEFGEDPVLA